MADDLVDEGVALLDEVALEGAVEEAQGGKPGERNGAECFEEGGGEVGLMRGRGERIEESAEALVDRGLGLGDEEGAEGGAVRGVGEPAIIEQAAREPGEGGGREGAGWSTRASVAERARPR